MKRIQLILASVLLASLPCVAQVRGRGRGAEGAAARAVLRAHGTFMDGVRRGDKRALSSVVSEDFIQTSALGKIGNKAEMVADTTSVPDFELFDLKVRVYGGVAVVTGAYGFAADRLVQRFTAVYRQSRGRWLMVSHQQTNISR